jgi:uncharacterized membrane-anchored protein
MTHPSFTAANLGQQSPAGLLPPDDGLRLALHNEIHARPHAIIRLPALLTHVAVLNQGVSREDECWHLSRLPGQQQLPASATKGYFLRLELAGYEVQWERHSEFTRYTVIQPLPDTGADGVLPPDPAPVLATPAGWLAGIPGRTIAAIQVVMFNMSLDDLPGAMAAVQPWFEPGANLIASQMGTGQSCTVTDFRVNADGFERMLVLLHPDSSASRPGRTSVRLLELETYRLMALRGLPPAKVLTPLLASVEAELASLTAQLESRAAVEQELLDRLIGLAARVERATAENSYRFSATRAYAELVMQRIEDLHEHPIPGVQTLGEFMRRRLTPAIATVASAERRLASLSERVARTSALLRTRVDIATEGQNQQLLEKLTRGQELQLRLQSTVEGLSIAAISYYVVSLLLYGAKALKGLGLPLQPELTAGALIPVVIWGVWRTTRRIHEKLHAGH